MTDEWQYTEEQGEPHGLCCASCKAARADVERLREALRIAAKALPQQFADLLNGLEVESAKADKDDDKQNERQLKLPGT